MKKNKTPSTSKSLTLKERKPRKPDIFDQDNTWKNYVEKNIFNCIKSTNLDLYVALDRSCPPEFLEQEMSNVMRGKYKISGKDKKADKLVKLRLLNGDYQIIYVHFEFQDELKDNFAERVYIYRSLIALRYQTQKITTIVIFTGKSPAAKHTIFQDECFGSAIRYQFNYYVIIDQDATRLEQSRNPFDLAALAAKYTLDTEGDLRRRYIFKKKLLEISLRKGFSFEETEELLSFVLDYMLLPHVMENEFIAENQNLIQPNSDKKMGLTRGQQFVKNHPLFIEWRRLEEAKAQAQADLAKVEAEKNKVEAEKNKVEAEKNKVEAEKNKVEAEKNKVEAEKNKVEVQAQLEKERLTKNIVLSLFALNQPLEKIAEVIEKDVEYVQKVIEKHTNQQNNDN